MDVEANSQRIGWYRANAASWLKGLGLLLALCVVSIAGCRPQSSSSADVQATVRFDPTPPAVGETKLVIELRDAAGQPLRLDQLEVEGNMNHAGMKPVFTTLAEDQPGQFSGTINFTMGGDWFLLLGGQMPDGTWLEKQIDVPGVKTK